MVSGESRCVPGAGEVWGRGSLNLRAGSAGICVNHIVRNIHVYDACACR